MQPPTMWELMMWIGTVLGVTAVIVLRHFFATPLFGTKCPKRRPRKRRRSPARKPRPRSRSPPVRKKKKK